MPELAEVERCRQTINHYCVNKRIVNVHAAVDDIVYANSTSKDFESAVTGRTVLQCVRYGKHLWLEMDGAGPCAMYHMGMTGNFYIRGEGDMLHLHNETGYSVEDTWPPKYTKCELEMEDGIQVAFVNARRLGRIRLEENPLECSSLKKLGFDAFKEVPPLAQFTKMLRKRKAPVKAVLLDQSFAAGVGNWLADEILYQSQIHPQEPSDRLSDEHIMSIYTALTSVIPTAVECSADATKFPREWMFHFRWNKKDPKDYYGRKIVFVTSGGRTAAIVPEIQIQRTGAGTTGKSTTSPSKKGTKRLEKLPPGSQMVLKGERSERMCVADEGSIGRRKNLRKSKNVVDTGNRATKIETLDCSEHPAVAQTQIIPAHIHSQRKAQTQLNLLSQPHPEVYPDEPADSDSGSGIHILATNEETKESTLASIHELAFQPRRKRTLRTSHSIHQHMNISSLPRERRHTTQHLPTASPYFATGTNISSSKKRSSSAVNINFVQYIRRSNRLNK